MPSQSATLYRLISICLPVGGIIMAILHLAPVSLPVHLKHSYSTFAAPSSTFSFLFTYAPLSFFFCFFNLNSLIMLPFSPPHH